MARVAFLALLALQSAQFAWPQNTARIFVYAQHETVARSWRPISCDGIAVAKIKRGTYFLLNVAPGRHVLSRENGMSAFVDVRAGSESFIRLDSQMEMGEAATPVLSNVHPDVAWQEMRLLLYIDAKQVLSALVSKTDPRTPPEPRLRTRNENK